MDKFFDELGRIIRSIFNDSGSHSYDYSDPYMQEAMEELDDYLNEDKSYNKNQTNDKDQRENKNWKEQHFYRSEAEKELKTLREDFECLKVQFGASLDDVKKAYKKQLRFYHPDKHADDEEKLKMATEITKKINASYNKIKAFYKKYPKYKK